MLCTTASLLLPKECDICRSRRKKAKQRKNTTNSQTTFHSNILPAFRAVKGSVGNIRQFTANPPTKLWGIPAPKKKIYKIKWFCQEKDWLLKPEEELSNLLKLFWFIASHPCQRTVSMYKFCSLCFSEWFFWHCFHLISVLNQCYTV